MQTIIVEGPDGSGKDTLIEALGFQSYKLKALRGGVGGTESYRGGNGLGDGTAGWAGEDPALLAYVKKLVAAKDAPKEERPVHESGQRVGIAFNRFHLSEYVYGPILRKTQEVSDSDLRWLTNFCAAQDVAVILCLPPWEETLRQVSRPGRERPAYQTAEFLEQAYWDFYALRRYAIVYDFTADPEAAVVKGLVKAITDVER